MKGHYGMLCVELFHICLDRNVNAEMCQHHSIRFAVYAIESSIMSLSVGICLVWKKYMQKYLM